MKTENIRKKTINSSRDEEGILCELKIWYPVFQFDEPPILLRF